jgi:hypothetical protein
MGHVCGDSNLHATSQETFICPAAKRFLATREKEPITGKRSSPQLGELDSVLEQSTTIRFQEQIRN